MFRREFPKKKRINFSKTTTQNQKLLEVEKIKFIKNGTTAAYSNFKSYLNKGENGNNKKNRVQFRL
ncbi:hypothetical protein LEP1GSC123_0484 [Leptospira borgpetersenii str. 200701203]|uniref:Uncharacterized protein n=1 Tax=Leptospira borgpetersenii str. 200701203 TaxID=1193007 RepID=M3H3J2_LEPBO|nr:hypothetical protein LEP1GSC123_0484 [Leptospira borgpetersenii str. 200701203]